MGLKRTSSGTRKIQESVLVATPSQKAVRLISRGLKRLSVSTTVLANGRSVINHLTARLTEDTDSDVPDLLILDHSLPEIDGETVVDAIKSSPRLGTLPIVLFSRDSSPTDRENAYALGVNAYITAPSENEAFVDVIETLATFWFEHATLPS